MLDLNFLYIVAIMANYSKDHDREKMGQRERLKIRREEIGETKMGDLHLKRFGMKGKSSRNFRHEVKHYSKKLRRRQGQKIARDWQSD